MKREVKKTMLDMVRDPWFKSRPKSVQKRVIQYPPGLYLLKPTGQKVVLISYTIAKDDSCDLCTVSVLKMHNPTCLLERRVFGIPFTDLEAIETL